MPKVMVSLISCLTVIVILLSSCKKNSDGPAAPNYNDSTHLTQKVSIKITATHPSPWDSANNPLADSVIINQFLPIGQDATGVTLYIGAVNEPGNASYSGFGFSYYYNGVYPFGTALLIITNNALPSVPGDLPLGTYSHTSVTNYEIAPVYMTMRGAMAGPGRYFTGAIPSDATDTAYSATTQCQVTFTKKFIVNMGNQTFRYASGMISGYESLRYGISDTAKYTQRWDFAVNFDNLAYDIN